MTASVLLDVDGSVAVVTLNRPERLNALDSPMTDLYLDLLREADADPRVGAIVVTGAGRGFCAGADTGPLSVVDPDDLDARVRSKPRDAAMHLDTPVVAAINGAAIGIGLCHALMADIRFAADDAKLAMGFAKLGLVAELGSSWLLPRLVGQGRARDLLLSGRTITGSEALSIGLVEFAHPRSDVLAAAVEYARALAGNSAYSMTTVKEQLDLDIDRSWNDAFADSQQRMVESLNRDEFRERLDALRTKGAK